MRDAGHHEANKHGDGISHDEARSGNRVGIIKGFISADCGDGIKNRCGQHVSEGAGNGEAIFDKAADHGDDGALTDGEDRPEQTTHKNGKRAVLGQPALEGIFWKIRSEKSTDDGAEENERKALKKDRKELEGGVLKLRFEFLAHAF